MRRRGSAGARTSVSQEANTLPGAAEKPVSDQLGSVPTAEPLTPPLACTAAVVASALLCPPCHVTDDGCNDAMPR